MPKKKRYVVQMFGYVGNYQDQAEYNFFIPAWFCMWTHNGLCSSTTMEDRKTGKRYDW